MGRSAMTGAGDGFPTETSTDLVPVPEPHTLSDLPAVREETAPLAPSPEPTDAERDAAREHLASLYDELKDLSDADPAQPPPMSYTQSAWDRKQVRWLQRAEAATGYLAGHPHLPGDEAQRRARLIIDGGAGALHRYLAALTPQAITASLERPMLEVLPSDAGTIYGGMATGKPPKPAPAGKRRRRQPPVVQAKVIPPGGAA
jgi:hypothetical protein